MGQGNNRGFAAKGAVAPIAQKAGTGDFKDDDDFQPARRRAALDRHRARQLGRAVAGSASRAGDAAASQPAAPAAPAAPAPAAAPVQRTIHSITVHGNQRLEPETIRAYANLDPGQTYTAKASIRRSRIFTRRSCSPTSTITGTETGDLVINVRENPVINRIILEGNKRLKDDKITPEIKLAPRQIFTRSAVRSDVDRILELYRRQGRFAARVDPKIVQLDQNRVDVVFEIHEGDLAKVRAINILGNKPFPDDRLRKEMYTRQAGGLLGFLKSNDTYDPDRLAADQQKLRAFYLTQGYADFRVVSGACRAHARPPGLRHHLRGRRRAALPFRHGRRRQRSSRLPQREGAPDRQDPGRQLVQRQGRSKTRSRTSTRPPATSAMPSPTSTRPITAMPTRR